MYTDAENTTSGAGGEVLLPEKLDTATATALHRLLSEKTGSDLILNGSAVEMLGGRCLDLLLSAKHHWTEAGRAMSIHHASDAMCRDLEAFGLSPDTFAERGVA